MDYKHFINPKLRRFIRRTLTTPTRLAYAAASKGIYQTENHQRILRLRDKHRGERCFIIGSGPSINQMELAPLKYEITFGFNAFFLIRDRVGFLPTYYVVEDPLPAEDNAATLNTLEGTTKIFPTDLRYCLKPDANTVYVYFDRYYSDYPCQDFPRFSEDVLRCVYWGGTVAYMALELAFYMGIREVYLLGIDLTYRIPVEAENAGVIVSREADASHFHPDYFGPGKRWHHPRVERMARAFDYAGQFFSSHGGTVYNATAGGKLDALRRVSYESVVKSESQ